MHLCVRNFVTRLVTRVTACDRFLSHIFEKLPILQHPRNSHDYLTPIDAKLAR